MLICVNIYKITNLSDAFDFYYLNKNSNLQLIKNIKYLNNSQLNDKINV